MNFWAGDRSRQDWAHRQLLLGLTLHSNQSLIVTLTAVQHIWVNFWQNPHTGLPCCLVTKAHGWPYMCGHKNVWSSFIYLFLDFVSFSPAVYHQRQKPCVHIIIDWLYFYIHIHYWILLLHFFTSNLNTKIIYTIFLNNSAHITLYYCCYY